MTRTDEDLLDVLTVTSERIAKLKRELDLLTDRRKTLVHDAAGRTDAAGHRRIANAEIARRGLISPQAVQWILERPAPADAA